LTGAALIWATRHRSTNGLGRCRLGLLTALNGFCLGFGAVRRLVLVGHAEAGLRNKDSSAASTVEGSGDG